MMDAMEETLYQHGVDAVFAGHVHAYESSYPVFRCASLPLTMAIYHVASAITLLSISEYIAFQARCNGLCLSSYLCLR